MDSISRIKSVLRQGAINGLILFRFIITEIQQVIASASCKNGFLASFYFTFFSTKFYREHKAVLQGIQKYRKADIRRQKTSSHLRRNIHRLEKGLIMRPRRETFAAGYITETVLLLKRARDSGMLAEDETKWAKDVLSQYFNVVLDTPKIKIARDIFLSISNAEVSNTYIPYPRNSVPDPKISYKRLIELFRRRRSIRWYLDKPVEGELISKAVAAASLAPSACNRQPFKFLILDQKSQAVNIAKMAGGTSGFAGNIPCLLVVVGDLSFYTEERDRHLIYIDAALASMQLMLALETLGLSSCPINWPDIEKREYLIQRELNLKIYERPIMQISTGYADPSGGIPFSQKKDADLLLQK